MIRLPAAVYVATAPVNLHLSFDRLAGIVREQLGGDPRGDALYFFHNRRGTNTREDPVARRQRILPFLQTARSGVYRIPLAVPAGAERVTGSKRELELMLAGIDRTVLRAARKAAVASTTTR